MTAQLTFEKFVLELNELMCEHGAHALVEADGVEQKKLQNKKSVLVANELLCVHGAVLSSKQMG